MVEISVYVSEYRIIYRQTIQEGERIFCATDILVTAPFLRITESVEELT